MFRLAHISDIHLGPLPQPSWRELAGKRMLGYLNWKKNRKRALSGNYLEKLLAGLPDLQPDHIVVSGDLINLALPCEFPLALEFLKSLGSAEFVTALCGNHDAYVPDGLSNAIKTWQPYMSPDDTPLQSQNDYPVLRLRGDVAIIACNSAEATGPFMATGYFRDSQAKKLKATLRANRGRFRVVIIHHPPFKNATHWHKRLIGDDLFRQVVAEEGAELVLHGHTHLATATEIPGSDSSVPVICVPAAGNGMGGKRPAGEINLFTINKTEAGFAFTHERYGCSQTEGTFAMLESTEY